MSSLTIPALSSSFPATCNSGFLHIARLVEQLEDLRNTASTTIELIRCGAAVIPPIAAALRFGKPKSVPQPRSALVSVLATLGANDVLLEYLTDDLSIEDPILRLAEDAVMNMAARAIKLDFSAEAYCALLNIARKRALPGVLEALSYYRRIESIPCFVRALESDLSRSVAVECLRTFGERARASLLAEIFQPVPGLPERESASSVHRRRACADVLSSTRLLGSEYEALTHRLLEEGDAELSLNICTILLTSDDPRHQRAAIHRLEAIRPHTDWFLQDELDVLIGRLEQKLRNQ